MRILIAPDSFKESLSAKEVADSIEYGLLRYDPSLDIVKVPMADGGEGTVIALVEATGGYLVNITVMDPLFRDVDAYYGILGDGKTAVIEMSAASGLALLDVDERNPEITSTYGTGQLINDALSRGCKKIIIGIGGSATNDGGAGMLRALGARFLDKNNVDIPEGGASLSKLSVIDFSNFNELLEQCEIIVACDVENTLCGENGASFVFGRQKGATDKMIIKLDLALKNYSEVICKVKGKNVENIKGSGAAGGMGAALIMLGAELKSGVDIVINETKLRDKLKDVDLVITGEGQMDFQTKFGKTPYGVAKQSMLLGVPVIAICGSISEGGECLYNYGFNSIFSIIDKPMDLKDAISNAKTLIEDTSERVIRLYKINREV